MGWDQSVDGRRCALALAGLIVARYDAPQLFAGLTSDGGAVMVAVSGLAGITTLLLVVPLWAALLHQAFAMVVLGLAVLHRRRLSAPALRLVD